MLFKSNFVALVGGGPKPRFPPNQVMIWDDNERCVRGEIAFKSPVRSVRLGMNRIAVALHQKVLLYDIDSLRLLQTIETAPNPKGLLALSPSEDGAVVASPGLQPGQVRIQHLNTNVLTFIHEDSLSALALSHNGKYVATASQKGTLIRVFSTTDGNKVSELQRGSDPATAFFIALLLVCPRQQPAGVVMLQGWKWMVYLNGWQQAVMNVFYMCSIGLVNQGLVAMQKRRLTRRWKEAEVAVQLECRIQTSYA